MRGTILDVRRLSKHYALPRGLFASLAGKRQVIPAVDDVSFYVKENETLGLVGESGCGKTTLGRTVLGLTPPTSGSVVFEGKEITALPPEELRALRARMQMIFQDPDAALDPKMRVRSILSEAVTVHRRAGDAEVEARIGELLEQVSLKKSLLTCYPDELSGGEKRRVGIARALAVGARFLVADEPTSALDVSIQAQVVNLLADLQARLGLSYLFISHDLHVVEILAHKVAVMYLGKIVETGLADRIARSPRHPYTRVLWNSLSETRGRRGIPLPATGKDGGEVPDHERPAAGCRFAPRCPVYEARGRPAICTDPASAPELSSTGTGHQAACHFPLS